KRNEFGASLADPTVSTNINYQLGDPSRIDLAGADSNTFTGPAQFRMVALQSANIPAGNSWTVDGTSGAVIFANGLGVSGSLTLRPGATVKGGSITVAPDGNIHAAGSSSEPVVFTSFSDDSIGGDTNADGPSAGNPGDHGTAIRLDRPGSSDVITNAVFKYADTAIAVGVLSVWAIHSNQFAKNNRAFTVDTTDQVDDSYAVLPCVPPYTTMINASSNWFGSTGWPGLAFDPADYFGLFLPAPFAAALTINVQILSYYEADTERALGTNTIPSAVFGCRVPGTDISIGFPVFAVNPIEPLPSEPFPAWAAG
ncbi:MAG: hypothetical protein ACRDNB_02265, partial [Gaiellaceae bacterium]